MTRTSHILLLAAAALLAFVPGCACICPCACGSLWNTPVAQNQHVGWEKLAREAPAEHLNSGSRLLAPDSAPTERSATPNLTIRGQSPGFSTDGNLRGPQPISGGAPPGAAAQAWSTYQPPATGNGANPYGAAPFVQPTPNYAYQPSTLPAPYLPAPPAEALPSFVPEIPATPTPLDVFVEETRTGQFMFGVTVNSNAGLVGNIVLSERNFDITNPPTSWDDFAIGRAWRGGGQGFRIEAQPGTVLQRYVVDFTEPYFLGTDNSFNISGYYFNRAYFDWTEGRVGGRLALGRRLTPDLSLAGSLRMEDVDIFNLRVLGVPALDAVRGHNDIFSGKVTLTHDTRDIPFAPTQGHLIQASFEQAFGEFSFPRGDFELAQYLLVRQRPDGSGRHTAGFITKVGVSGSDTPIFENYFAGGFSTIRGYQFRGASPKQGGVVTGGRFQWLNSAEYYFPLTADDMIRATLFVDFGTVEQNVALHSDQFRVAPGFGFRINVPAMGPAPLAFDFAFPVASAATDNKQVFSFFFGATR